MAELGKKQGTVKKEAVCLTGYGTSLTTSQGDQVGIVAPSMRGLEKVWAALNWVTPLDKTMVHRVVYFNHKSLTTLRPRKRKTDLNRGVEQK